MTPRKSGASSKTVARAFRITHTQHNLLETSLYKDKASAIVRVLLQLYFNKRIPGVDSLIEAERILIKENVEKNFERFREMLRNQGVEKKKERASRNGINTGGI